MRWTVSPTSSHSSRARLYVRSTCGAANPCRAMSSGPQRRLQVQLPARALGCRRTSRQHLQRLRQVVDRVAVGRPGLGVFRGPPEVGEGALGIVPLEEMVRQLRGVLACAIGIARL